MEVLADYKQIRGLVSERNRLRQMLINLCEANSNPQSQMDDLWKEAENLLVEIDNA